MEDLQVLLPKMGESVAEATITKWLKAVGDKVEAEESLVEIATDKVDSEVPSPGSGVLTKILYKVGDVVKVGETIAVLNVAPVSGKPIEKTSSTSSVSLRENQDDLIKTKKEDSPLIISTNASNQFLGEKNLKYGETDQKKEESYQFDSKRFYSPLVRNIAKQEGISFTELEALSGSGKEGRVTKMDLLNYLPQKREKEIKLKEGEKVTNGIEIKQEIIKGEIERRNDDLFEIIEMDRMRKLIADHMVMSKQTSPHVTSYVEADVTNLVVWREKAKKIFEKRDGEKITFTPLFVEAVVKALKDFPMVNVSVEGYKIIRKKFINIGMATALPSGNLIVPVIKNADHLNLLGLTKMVNDLSNRARTNKLKPDEIQNGTFTISNVGTFGNVMGAPIINQPQVAIMALGAIRKKPAVIETPMGDTIGIRHQMFLSLSYDHRVVDGVLGGSFLRRVADYLEKFDVKREI